MLKFDPCERVDCHTCTQGGEERKEDCFKRNILYESRCIKCKEDQELEEQVLNGHKKRKNAFNPKERGVYVGESSRSIFERTKEQLEDARKDAPDSHIRKHWRECHPEDEQMPHFRFKIIKTFKDSLSRQVAESVRIDLREGVINSKAMYSRNRLPRLEVEKPEWERNEEERKRKIQEWNQKENWDLRTKTQEEEESLRQVEETENMMTESWRESRVRRVREMNEIEEEDLHRSKKRRRGHYDGDTQWGLSVLSEEEKERQKWLSETCCLKEQECKSR